MATWTTSSKIRFKNTFHLSFFGCFVWLLPKFLSVLEPRVTPMCGFGSLGRKFQIRHIFVIATLFPWIILIWLLIPGNKLLHTVSTLQCRHWQWYSTWVPPPAEHSDWAPCNSDYQKLREASRIENLRIRFRRFSKIFDFDFRMRHARRSNKYVRLYCTIVF